LQEPLNFTQIGILGSKTNHLATLPGSGMEERQKWEDFRWPKPAVNHLRHSAFIEWTPFLFATIGFVRSGGFVRKHFGDFVRTRFGFFCPKFEWRALSMGHLGIPEYLSARSGVDVMITIFCDF
jgi:hypothetical protein